MERLEFIKTLALGAGALVVYGGSAGAKTITLPEVKPPIPRERWEVDWLNHPAHIITISEKYIVIDYSYVETASLIEKHLWVREVGKSRNLFLTKDNEVRYRIAPDYRQACKVFYSFLTTESMNEFLLGLDSDFPGSRIESIQNLIREKPTLSERYNIEYKHSNMAMVTNKKGQRNLI